MMVRKISEVFLLLLSSFLNPWILPIACVQVMHISQLIGW